MVLWVILGILVLVVLYIWSLYNGLITQSTQIDEAGSQINVQLKRRADLIPNLVETVRGYAKHEKSVFEDVTKARSAMLKADSPAKTAQAENMLSGALKNLFALAENYPQLKANENFIELQKELSDTEDKIAYSRQFYNSQLMEFNVKVKTFPNSLLATSFGFKEKQFFQVSEEDQKPVKVKFS